MAFKFALICQKQNQIETELLKFRFLYHKRDFLKHPIRLINYEQNIKRSELPFFKTLLFPFKMDMN